MHYKAFEQGYFLQVQRGDDLMQTLVDFCIEQDIASGLVSGLGAADDLEIAYFDVETKQYQSKRFNEISYEIVSLTGNIALVDGKPFAHVHGVFGDASYQLFGGHVLSAVVSVTAELMITMTDGRLERRLDEEVQLKLIDCGI